MENEDVGLTDERYLKVALQGGLAVVGAFLVWMMAWRQDGRLEAMHEAIQAHAAATAPLQNEVFGLKLQIERQTEIQRQMCVMQARAQRVSPDICWQSPSR
jgi:hypothetical protein